MLKRFLALVLAFTMTACLFSGCSAPESTVSTTESEALPMNIMQKSDPTQDDELNILMIGNSLCYYYVEELYGMLTTAGYKNVNVCNVYYSGCPLESHWKWWKSGEANYEYFTTNADGRNKIQPANLEYCMQQHNWDLITLQESSSKVRSSGGAAPHLALTRQYLTDLWGYIKEQYPMSRHAWQQTWAYQIGYDRSGYKMESIAQQNLDTLAMEDYAIAVCKEYELERINSGRAWQIVREGGYDNLCARLSVNAGEGDYYHDGDIGGGQYLNACVWFECITGQSCIGNSYRPDYQLDEALISKLQEAAHQAVASMNA